MSDQGDPMNTYTCENCGVTVTTTAALRECLSQEGELLYMVECDLPRLSRDGRAIRVDHHRPGDPGYGKPPEDYMEASSLGQVLKILGVSPTEEHRLIAAADHCLAAAYRGKCPGVDPEYLMRWRAVSRATFQGRPVDDVIRDVEAARRALREASVLRLGRNEFAMDMRGLKLPELPEAAAREGLCFVAEAPPGPDRRVKVVCQSGSPEQIRAFMEEWAPAQGLIDIYGDPARGFAGAYRPPEGEEAGTSTLFWYDPASESWRTLTTKKDEKGDPNAK